LRQVLRILADGTVREAHVRVDRPPIDGGEGLMGASADLRVDALGPLEQRDTASRR
jgi:hypothetical protein